MAKYRATARQIFFRWEKRGGLLRSLRVDRVRPALVLLLAIALVMVIGARERRGAGIRRTHATILNARTAVDSYMADHDGGCPGHGFASLGDYRNVDEPPKDAWGKPLTLECPGRERARYDVYSDGPDGLRGGLDRIQ